MKQLATWVKTKTIRAAKEIISSDARFIDYSVELRVVRRDANGYLPAFSGERVSTLRTHRFGGVWDARRRAFVGYSRTPIVWYVSEEQERPVLHRDLPLKVIVAGGEGSGKTRGVLAPWIGLRLLSFAGQFVEMGATAPTGNRLVAIEQALKEKMPPSWYSYNGKTRTLRLHCGPTVRFVSAQIYSEESGSPLQSYNWVAHAGDELQDHTSVENDIETRLRAAKGGKSYRMNTATMKPTSQFRNFLDEWNANPLCDTIYLPGQTNVFVSPTHWENLKLKLPPNEYRRRVLCEWVPSERATYYTWDRSVNCRRIPPTAIDVTEKVLAGFSRSPRHALVGHDPGTLRDTSIILKAFMMPRSPHVYWWVIGECVTGPTTTAEHIVQLQLTLARLGITDKRWPQRYPIVFADPSSKYETHDQPHTTVYKVFRNHGIDIRSAAPSTKRVPVKSGIEMIVGLIKSASGHSRLFVDIDQSGQPVAPLLVKSFEHAERDEAGRAEQERKSKRYKDKDYSDAPAALRYGLWLVERPMERMESAA